MQCAVFATLMGCALAGCATVHTRAAFEAFPENFDAIQVMQVEGIVNGSPIKKEFLSSVSRQGEAVQIVLMDPFWQKALLKASYGAEGYSVTPLVEGVALPFPGEEIVDTARQVFHWKGTLDAAGAAEIQTRRFAVTIRDVGGDGNCLFPRVMQLQPRVADAPRLTISTKDWRCS